MIAVSVNNVPARRALSPTKKARTRASAPARRRARPRFAFGLTVVGIISGLGLAYVAETAMATQSSYQIAGLKAQQADLIAQQQQTRYQISIATSAGRLDGEALALGMVRPTSWQYVQGSSSRVALLRTEPDATPKETRTLFDQVAAALGQPTVAEARGR